MVENVIIAKKVGHLGVLTLNRPQSLNALNVSMIQEMHAQLRAWETDASVYAVVVQSSSSKAFCAGGDVRWLYDHQGKLEDQCSFFCQEYQLNHCIHTYKKPYIALMDGITMGGGVGISLHGSHPVATERFSFAMPETNIGFFPDIGSSYLLSRCPSYQGIYLGLTGARITTNETNAVGLIKYQLHSEQLEALMLQLTELDLSKNAHDVIDQCLMAFMSDNTAIKNVEKKKSEEKLEGTGGALRKEWIASCFSNDSVEAIVEALKQSCQTTTPLQADWAQQTLAALEKKSPISLKVTLAQIQRAQKLSFAECLNMDYVLAQHFMKSHDFYEGVRAVLVDKDKLPKWKPARLEAINKTEVASYFQCSTDEQNGQNSPFPIKIGNA
ncbi:MAG: enoyl-CoA hydratase/isomerase family protein [Legionella sp.]|nr:enoyl-CoA hydratase/isomerase family protein [Legionella sp.]